MAIKASTSKVLWGRSGNRCAICGTALTTDGASGDPLALGMEAHIVARSNEGPRGDASFEGDRDGVANLILLCASDHMLVDKDPIQFSVAELQRIKREHEARVEQRLSPTQAIKIIGPNGGLATLVSSASELWDMVIGAEAAQFHSPDPETDEEAELLADILGYWEDTWSISSDLGQGEAIRIKHEMSHQLTALWEAGFAVFATAIEGRLAGGAVPDMPWRTGLVKVARAHQGRQAQPVDADDLTVDERAVFAVMLETFVEKGIWPTLPVLSKRVHKRLGLDAVKVLDHVPVGLTADETAGRIYRGQQGRIGLTIAGIALTEGSERLTEMFMDALRLLVQLEDAYEPDDETDLPEAQIEPVDALASVFRSDIERRQLIHMLERAVIVVNGRGGSEPHEWQFEPRELLRQFADAAGIEDFLVKRRELLFGVLPTAAPPRPAPA